MTKKDNQLLLQISNIAIRAGIKAMEYYKKDILVEESK